ncbi:hypothetical protein AVEN_135096-1 [Araneus ventricosus]|uniref:Uncharacterized protein n=1 Tax=Araneus ventricosus TaxID=182803 RepID=A0A4Y2M4I2_ARAVE|nr:hypothetical protein AVEN_135096-1 [Araneus ventricosus]
MEGREQVITDDISRIRKLPYEITSIEIGALVGAERSSHQLPSSHCGRSSKVVPNGSTTYRSASNNLLARTADRTPKTFALQGNPSRPTQPPSSKRSPSTVFLAGCDVTWNDLAHSWRIFSPNRDVEKIPAPLRSHISSPMSPNLLLSFSPKSRV